MAKYRQKVASKIVDFVKSKLKPGVRRRSVGSSSAVRQARVRFLTGLPMGGGFSLGERRSDEDTRRQASAYDEG
jgi:hypothetical protein